MDETLSPETARARLRHVKILSVVDTPSLDALAQRLTWRRVRLGEEVVSHLDREHRSSSRLRALSTLSSRRRSAAR